MTLALLKRLALPTLLLAGAAAASAAEPQKVIVSASKGDPSLALARQLCVVVGQQAKRYNLECESRESGNDVAALQALDGEAIQVALARADWLAQAASGTGPFRDRGPVRGSGRERRGGPNEELRSLFALQVDTFILVARAEAGIKSPADLKGKRINIGPPGSGGRIMFELVAPALGWTLRDFAVAAELKTADQLDALCRGRVDAVLYLAANPDAGVRATAQACETTLVPVAGKEIEALDKGSAVLLRVPVPGGIYKGAPREVPTVGFAVVAASTSKVDAQAVYQLVRATFEQLGRLQRADPVYARLDPRRMTGDGLVVPLHEGAAKYYKERGWIR